ncbi:MAG: DUF4330 family protein [Eubacteriales bacterium]
MEQNKKTEKKSEKKPEKRPLIDKNGRLFGAVSLIDIVVILAIIVVCAGVYLKNNVLVTTSTSGENSKISMTFEVRLVEDYVADALQIGDAVYDKDHATGGAIGHITKIEYTEPSGSREINDGTFSLVGSDREVNVLVTLEGTGSYIDGRYSFNRVYEMGVNAARTFQTKYVKVTGFVTEIFVVE